jgi:hypothetical protein
LWCRHKPTLAEHVAEMVFLGVKSPDHSLHFFRLLTLLTELSGLADFLKINIWDTGTGTVTKER